MEKKVGIMQPYLFPYIGYWQLLNYVDEFVVYDDIKFTKGSWIRKNKFLIFGKEKIFSIPVSKGSDDLNIIDRIISEEFIVGRKKILKQIQSSYNKAPYFDDVYPLLEKCFMYEDDNLFNFIYFSIETVMSYLSVETKLIKSSNLISNEKLKGKHRVIDICKQLNATEYINPPGGIHLYDKDEFNLFNIRLNFLIPEKVTYNQFENEFVSNLSIIDILMFNSVEDIQNMLNNFELI